MELGNSTTPWIEERKQTAAGHGGDNRFKVVCVWHLYYRRCGDAS